MLDDNRLAKLSLGGDDKAFKELTERYLENIYNFVYRYVSSEGDAQDITQEVFFRAWKNLHKFDEGKKFKTWIFAIAKNASLDWLKKKKPRLFSEFENSEGDNFIESNILDTSPLPEEIFMQRDISEKLSNALTFLAPDERAILVLHYNDHLTFEEIAESLKKPMNTVKSRHRRALGKLKKILIEPNFS